MTYTGKGNATSDVYTWNGTRWVADAVAGGGSQTLAQTLNLGNTTDGYDIDLTQGSRIKSTDGVVTIQDSLDIFGDGYISGDFTIAGKLTVDGLIDPTGLVLNAQATKPFNETSIVNGVLWINNADGYLYYNDSVISGTTSSLTGPTLNQDGYVAIANGGDLSFIRGNDGQVLTWNETNGTWEAGAAAAITPGNNNQAFVSVESADPGFVSTTPRVVETTNGTDLIVCNDLTTAINWGFSVNGSISNYSVSVGGDFPLSDGVYDITEWSTSGSGFPFGGTPWVCYINSGTVTGMYTGGGALFQNGDTVTITKVNNIAPTSTSAVITITSVNSYPGTIRQGIAYNNGTSWTSYNPISSLEKSESVQYIKKDPVSGKIWAFVSNVSEDVNYSKKYKSYFYEVTSLNPLTLGSRTQLVDMSANPCYTVSSIAIDPAGFFWICTSTGGLGSTFKILKWNPNTGTTVDEFITNGSTEYHSMNVDDSTAKYSGGPSRLIARSAYSSGLSRIQLTTGYTYESTNTLPTNYVDEGVGLTIDKVNNFMWSVQRYNNGNFRIFKANLEPFANLLYDVEIFGDSSPEMVSFVFDTSTQKGYLLFYAGSDPGSSTGLPARIVIVQDTGSALNILSSQSYANVPQPWPNSSVQQNWKPQGSIINGKAYLPAYGLYNYVFDSTIFEIDTTTNVIGILGNVKSTQWKSIDLGDLKWDTSNNLRVKSLTDASGNTRPISYIGNTGYLYHNGTNFFTNEIPPEKYAAGDITFSQTLGSPLTRNAVYTISTASPLNIGLPTFPSTSTKITIKNNTAGIGPYTISSSYAIDDAFSFTLNEPYGSVELLFNGSKWVKLNQYSPNVYFGANITTSTSLASPGARHSVHKITTASAITITLPSAPVINSKITIKNTTTSAGPYTIQRSGSQLIDGAVSFTLTDPYGSVTLVFDGTNWHKSSDLQSEKNYSGTNITGAVTLASPGIRHVVYKITTAGTYTITLPASPNINSKITIKEAVGSAGPYTIARSGSQLIDGATSTSLSGAYSAVELMFDGTNWFKTGGGSSAQTLAQTLTAGNTTGATNIVVSTGASITGQTALTLTGATTLSLTGTTTASLTGVGTTVSGSTGALTLTGATGALTATTGALALTGGTSLTLKGTTGGTALTWPSADGSANYLMKTNGAGVLSLVDAHTIDFVNSGVITRPAPENVTTTASIADAATSTTSVPLNDGDGLYLLTIAVIGRDQSSNIYQAHRQVTARLSSGVITIDSQRDVYVSGTDMVVFYTDQGSNNLGIGVSNNTPGVQTLRARISTGWIYIPIPPAP